MSLEKITPEIERILREQHTFDSDSAQMLRYIVGTWRGFNTPLTFLKGLRVLDLGSGSVGDSDEPSRYPPHFSRVCAVNGAKVVAIDLKPQTGIDKILFESASADLVDVVINSGLQNMPILQGKEFDIIYSWGLVGRNFDPGLEEQLRRRELKKRQFQDFLFNQASKLLAENGVITIGETTSVMVPILYTRRDSDIVRLD